MVRFPFGLFSAAYLGCKSPYFGFTTFSLLESKVESRAFTGSRAGLLKSWLKTWDRRTRFDE